MNVVFVILAANITAAIGQLLLKMGMSSVGQVDGIYFDKILQMFTNPIVLAGLVVFGISTIFWLTALSRKDLSYVYPFFAINMILVFLLSFLFLHETIGAMRIFGAIIIVGGIFVVAMS
jgi:drug/metabolite transporter (DMT)-like permease